MTLTSPIDYTAIPTHECTNAVFTHHRKDVDDVKNTKTTTKTKHDIKPVKELFGDYKHQAEVQIAGRRGSNLNKDNKKKTQTVANKEKPKDKTKKTEGKKTGWFHHVLDFE